MPIYKDKGKKDGLQKYRVRINYTDSFGKSHQLTRAAYGLDNAKALERALQHEVAKGEVSAKITVSELADEFINVKKHEIRETSLDNYKKHFRLYITPYLGEYRADKLNVPILQKWKLYMEERTPPLSQTTKQNIYADLRSLLNYAVKMEYIPKNPLTALGNFKSAMKSEKNVDFYTLDEFRLYITAARKSAEEYEKKGSIFEWGFYVFFNIAFFGGLRKGEINALKWSDIYDNTIHVRRSIAQKLQGADRETPPKNASSIRDVQIPEPLKIVLDEHKKKYSEVDGFNEDWRVCGGIQCLRDTTIQHRNEKYAKAAGIKTIRIHDFRHSHCALLANAGINIQEIARRLGHSNTEETWNTYSHLYPAEEDRALAVLNGIKI